MLIKNIIDLSSNMIIKTFSGVFQNFVTTSNDILDRYAPVVEVTQESNLSN